MALNAEIYHAYSGQGSGLPYFVGRQYGAGWFRNAIRFAFPFLRKAIGTVGNIAANTAQDMINDENKSLGDTLKDNAVKVVTRVMKRLAPPPTINKG